MARSLVAAAVRRRGTRHVELATSLVSIRLRSAVLVLVTIAAAACGGGTSGPPDPPVEQRPPLEIVAGAAQQGTIGIPVAAAPTVIVRDDSGRPAPGTPVTFEVRAGGGWTAAVQATADAQGLASTAWYLGTSTGEQRLRAIARGDTVEFTADAQPLQAGRAYFGAHLYIEIIGGDLPVIVTAPHGGSLAPAEIPDRTSGTIGADLNTEDLARRIADSLAARTGRTPFVVINRLHRRKLDANREIVEAAQGNPAAERAWHEFNTFIEAASAQLVARFGSGLLVDVHGHSHPIARLELGYLLTAADLGRTDAQLNTSSMVRKSSLRHIAENSGRPFAELIRGPASLGALFAAHGYRAVPGPTEPEPGADPYFTGGYITQRHGSSNGGTISAVQIESPLIGVRATPAERAAFASAVAGVLDDYFRTWYAAPLVSARVRAGTRPLASYRTAGSGS